MLKSGTDNKQPKVKRSEVLPERYQQVGLKFGDDDSTATENGALYLSADGESYVLPTRDAWTNDLCRKITAGVEDRRSAGFDDNVRTWRSQYEAEKRPRNIPWENCANLRPPLTRSIVDTLRANVYKAVFGQNPYFKVGVEDGDNSDTAQLIEAAINSICRSKVKLASIGRKALLRAFVDGTAICVPYWQVEVSKKRSWEQVTPELKALVAQAAQQGDAAAKALLPQVETVPDNEWRTLLREEVTKDQAQVDLVDVLDFCLYPASVRKLGDAQVQAARVWYTQDQLLHGAKNGQFEPDAVQELLDNTPKSPGRFSEESGGDRTRFESQGLPTTDTYNASHDPYECFRGLYRTDADGDGLPEWVLFEVALHEKILLRAEIYPYFHDRPFFVPITPYTRDDMPYGYSLTQILQDLQTELEEIRNQRVDNGTLRNTVSFAVARTAKWNPEQTPFTPGMVFPVNNPKEDIVPLNFGNGDQSQFAEDTLVRQDMKEVSAVNDTLLSQAPGGDTTLGETDRALQGANTKFQVNIDDVSEGFSEIARQIKGLYAQYQPETMEFNAGTTAAPVFKSISRADMQTDCDFYVYGSADLMNDGLQAQIGEKLVMFAERSPFIQADLTRLYELQRYALHAFKVPNPEIFLGSFEDAQRMQEEKAQEPPPPPETRVSRTEKRDEILTLAIAIKDGEITDEEYLMAAQLAGRANLMLPEVPAGSAVGDATDDAAGYGRKESTQSNPTNGGTDR